MCDQYEGLTVPRPVLSLSRSSRLLHHHHSDSIYITAIAFPDRLCMDRLCILTSQRIGCTSVREGSRRLGPQIGTARRRCIAVYRFCDLWLVPDHCSTNRWACCARLGSWWHHRPGQHFHQRYVELWVCTTSCWLEPANNTLAGSEASSWQ